MSTLQLAGVQRGQLRIPARGQFGRLDQRALQPVIALLRDGTALLFARRRFQGGGQPAVTHGLGAGAKAARVADLQRPSQGSDFPDGWNAHQPFDAFGQFGIGEQIAHQPLLRALEHLQSAPAQAQQIDNRLRHLFEFFQQIGKVSLAM